MEIKNEWRDEVHAMAIYLRNLMSFCLVNNMLSLLFPTLEKYDYTVEQIRLLLWIDNEDL